MLDKLKYILFLTLLLLNINIFAEQDTRYNSDKNLPFNDKAGNVNPQTGDITLSYTDLSLPGRGGLDFKFTRTWTLSRSNVYNMFNNQRLGVNQLNSNTLDRINKLGVGWSSDQPFIQDDNSSGKLVKTLFFGSAYQIDQTMLSVQDPTRSNLIGYDLLDKRVYEDSSLTCTLDILSDLKSRYEIDGQIRSKYVLVLSDNSKYYFRPDGQLMMQQDRTGLNKIWYFYDIPSGDNKAKLVLVYDSIGREIRFSYDENSNISQISWDVEMGIKNTDGTREVITETKSVKYLYENGENYSNISDLKNSVIDYKTPFVLKKVIDPMGLESSYSYDEGLANFTYDKTKSMSKNVYLLLKDITTYPNEDGTYLNKRVFEYDKPTNSSQDMYTKYFYKGLMEYFKVSRQYNLNRHGELFYDNKYYYNENGSAGNYSSYSTVIVSNNVTATYKYSLENNASKKDVLESVLTETKDGYINLTENVYDTKRRKIFQSTSINGSYLYDEEFSYDDKGNLKWTREKLGLEVYTEYDPIFSIPVRTVKTLSPTEDYENETKINSIGQVLEEITYVKDESGQKRAIVDARYKYDQYGNVIIIIDAHNNEIHTEYDSKYNAFPTKISQNVTIDSWSNGNIKDNWMTEPDTKVVSTISSNKIYNSDGSVWIAFDNDNFAVESYYDKLGNQIEIINPDEDDYTDFTSLSNNTELATFLSSRVNNPGSRIEIDYRNDYVKTYVDIDKDKGFEKVTAIQKDGMGNTEEEITYDASKSKYSVRSMQYDTLGNMVALTDPDADLTKNPQIVKVNGVDVKRYDKTWIVKYDDLGRKIKVVYPITRESKNDIKNISYDDVDNSTTTVDPEGRTVYEKRDWNGNTIEVTGYGDILTRQDQYQTYTYTYDKLNRKITFTDPMGLLTTYKYDERNLILEQNYGLESGSDFMTYNDLGQVVTKTDRKKQIIYFEYDELGRSISSKHYRTLTDFNNKNHIRNVRSIYDNRGNLVRVDNQDLIEYYNYDHSNRVINLNRRISDNDLILEVNSILNKELDSYDYGYTYNDTGMVTSMRYPDGSLHEFDYDSALARLKDISVDSEKFITNIDYNKSDVVTDMKWQNGVTQHWKFDNRKRINNINIVRDNSTSIENLNYKLNGNGDILSINENTYKYDGFNRIIAANTLNPLVKDNLKIVQEAFGGFKDLNDPSLPSFTVEADLNNDNRIDVHDHFLALQEDRDSFYDEEHFTYDKNGNRLTLNQNGDVYTYTYGIRNRLESIHLRERGQSTSRLFTEYKYDANGNTIERIVNKDTGTETIKFEYDVLNRLLKTVEDDNTTTYLYDNVGNRFIKKKSNGDKTAYLRHGQIAVAMDIDIFGDNATKLGEINRYVLSGDLTAGRVTTVVNKDNTKETKKSYYHLDHLNSTKVVTAEDATVEVNYTYRAFGEQLKRLNEKKEEVDDLAKYSYGGKELDDNTNLYYFNARYYDATIGRFINVDPIQDGTNWYIYCNNNPLNMIDPTGLSEFSLYSFNRAATMFSSFVKNPIKTAEAISAERLKSAKDSELNNTSQLLRDYNAFKQDYKMHDINTSANISDNESTESRLMNFSSEHTVNFSEGTNSINTSLGLAQTTTKVGDGQISLNYANLSASLGIKNMAPHASVEATGVQVAYTNSFMSLSLELGSIGAGFDLGNPAKLSKDVAPKGDNSGTGVKASFSLKGFLSKVFGKKNKSSESKDSGKDKGK